MNQTIEQLQRNIQNRETVDSYYLGFLKGEERGDQDPAVTRTHLFGLVDHPKWRYCLVSERLETEDHGVPLLQFADHVAALDYSRLGDALRGLPASVLQHLVADLLRSSSDYDLFSEDPSFSGLPVDIIGFRCDHRTHERVRYLFEVKSTPTATLNLVRELEHQRDSLLERASDARFIAVIAGRLSPPAREEAKRVRLSVWDIETLGMLLMRHRDVEGRYFGEQDVTPMLSTSVRYSTGASDEVPEDSLVQFRLVDFSGLQPMTPEYLGTTIVPYLRAIAELQRILDEIRRIPTRLILVRSVSSRSPAIVSLEGAAEATETVREMVVPWRRKHAKTMSQLEEQEKVMQIEKNKAEVREIRARAHRERTEAKKLRADAERKRAEAERLDLENEMRRLEIQGSRIHLALRVLDTVAPDLSESQRIQYTVQLLKPLEVLTESPLQLTNPESEAE